MMSDLEKCLALYNEVFSDDDNGEFATELFENCFEHCRFLKIGETVVSMLFALPCEIVYESSVKKAFYVFAVATKMQERGKGYMSKLINDLKSSTDDFLFLRPASTDLITLYKKLGFKTITAKESENGFPLVKPTGTFSALGEHYKTITDNTFVAMYYNNKEKLINNLNFAYSME